MQVSSPARRELLFGLIGAATVVAMLVATGVVYAIPFGKTTYAAELTEAQSIKAGDDVRVAGIPVGKVTELTLRPDRVHMRFTVSREVFVGRDSTLDIRMLTLAGGHYVALRSAGEQPLGSGTIPTDRVRIPYSLMRAFQDATVPVRTIDGEQLRKNFAAIDTAIDAAPDGLRSTLTGLQSLVDVLNRQHDDVSKALSIASEYLGAIDSARSELGRLITKINLLETVLIDHRAQINEALRMLISLVGRIGALQPAWESTLKPMARELANAIPQLEQLGSKFDGVLRDAHELAGKLRGLATPAGGVAVDQSQLTVEVPTVCIPVPGKGC